MSQTSPSLTLPYIQAAQAQKHVTHNEAIERLDLLTQLVVQDFDLATPPGGASEGHSWTIGPGASGDWAGRTGQIASWRGGGWLYVVPATGWRAWGVASGDIRVYSGGNWDVLPGAAPDFDNLAGVGINAASDPTNRLAVAADATLLNHDGSGHQLKINKAATGETASLLYQTGFSGRAEMGLAGNDDFSVKTSADGAAFQEALRIDAATGMTQAACITGDGVDLAADSVINLPTPALAGAVVLVVLRTGSVPHPLAAHSGMFIYDTGASPGVVQIGAGPQIVNLGSATLTPTSGTAGSSGIAAATGVLQIVNRSTETLTYNLTFLGGLPGR